MIMVDTLLLGRSELQMLCNKYNLIEITKLTNTSNDLQEYRILIELVDEEGYYIFLVDNWLSRTSTKFLFANVYTTIKWEALCQQLN